MSITAFLVYVAIGALVVFIVLGGVSALRGEKPLARGARQAPPEGGADLKQMRTPDQATAPVATAAEASKPSPAPPDELLVVAAVPQIVPSSTVATLPDAPASAPEPPVDPAAAPQGDHPTQKRLASPLTLPSQESLAEVHENRASDQREDAAERGAEPVSTAPELPSGSARLSPPAEPARGLAGPAAPDNPPQAGQILYEPLAALPPPPAPMAFPKAPTRSLPPLPFTRSPVPAARPKAVRRRDLAIFDLEHYRRHEGVPGYLYMARNPFQVEGLFKLGYTTLTPDSRLGQLNKEHGLEPEVGAFHLVHSVPVPGAYDAEQALFDLLKAERPVEKREFFLHSEELFRRALDATASFFAGEEDALDDFVTWRVGMPDVEPPAPTRPVYVPPLAPSDDGWIYIVKCDWHRSTVFRVSYTSKDPRSVIAELDARQRKYTCRVGFHSLVHCRPVDDLNSAWAKASEGLEPWRVKSTRVFFEAPLEQLALAISAGASSASKPAPPPPLPPDAPPRPTPAAVKPEPASGYASPPAWAIFTAGATGEVSVQLVRDSAERLRVGWDKPCPSCGKTLKFTGPVGARRVIACPSCKSSLRCAFGPGGVLIAAFDGSRH